MSDGRPAETVNKRYAEIRDDIRDGDIFMFQGAFRSSKAFEWMFKTFYSHAAIVAGWDDRLMILQAEAKGIETIPLSVAVGTYPGRADWYRLRRDDWPNWKENLPRVLWEAKADLGLKYGYKALFKALWETIKKEKLKGALRSMHPKGMFCSQYVEHCFRAGGMALSDVPPGATLPKQIAVSKHIEYQATILHDPAKPGDRDDDDVPAFMRSARRSSTVLRVPPAAPPSGP